MARRDITIEDTLRDEIVTVQGAVILPPPLGAKNAPSQRSGVFDGNEDIVKASHTCRPYGYFNDVPDYPAEAEILTQPGTWMFGGTFFGHFGHFIMDTAARS